MVILLSSHRTMSFSRPRWPAMATASMPTPSMRSPSEAKAKVRWFTTSKPGRLKREARNRSAMAMPHALPRPWPSGPVVVSTPAVWPTSGWPGVLEPHWRKAFSSSSGRS